MEGIFRVRNESAVKGESRKDIYGGPQEGQGKGSRRHIAKPVVDYLDKENDCNHGGRKRSSKGHRYRRGPTPLVAGKGVNPVGVGPD